MIRRTLWRVTTLLIVLSVAVPWVHAAPPRDDPIPPRGAVAPKDLERVEEVSTELAMSKIDPLLREAAEKGGKETVDLYAAVKEGTDLSEYMSRTIVRPAIFGGTQNIYGQTTASNLLKIAQKPGVLALVKVGSELEQKPYDPEPKDARATADNLARLETLRANELTHAEAEARAGDVGAEGWFDVLDGHKSKEAWKKGFTGDGVVVGVLDDGIDFAHPDLQGTYATVTDPASPHYGWPMAFSYVSMLYFVQDIVFGVSGIAEGWNGSRWTDAQMTVEAHPEFEGGTAKVVYQPLGSGFPHEYTIPTTGQSNFYKLGSFPEKNLLSLYGERVAVLVVDEHAAGEYDTVYVDLDNDYDFTDEKPVTKSSPEIYRDMDGDGYADISGGLLVWISDGENTPPMADWLWGITCADESATMKGCPDSGELVLFAGPFDGGYTHGTQCASNVAGQGVVNEGLTAQPFREGGMVQGAAPNVGLMDFGNHYYTGTDEDEFLVAALGYDGVPNTGDEVQITSNSYGNFRQMWGGWGYYGRLITALNTTLAPSTVWLFSAGNEGPGYGPQEGDGSPTTIQVGSSTQYGSTNWDSIYDAEQIAHGDVTAFFSHGPNRDGSSGLDVLANGGRGAGDEGINYYGYDGAESWATWGGTSRSAPVAAGNLALVYEAFKDRHGRWPTWQEAKALLKNGADNASGSPFYQGAGVVNADRATDLAAGIYGAYATPDEWQVGDWKGEEYLNFAKVAYPGDTFEKTYTVHNPSGHDITVDLSDGVMEKIESSELTFTTSDESEESSFNFHSPDYLMELDHSLIPSDAELMVVRYVHPYDTFDPAYDFTPLPNSSWRFLFYNWTDQNGDGMLWEDQDGNGVVNHVDDLALGPDNDGFYRPDYSDPETEIQQGEYIRMDYDFGGLAQMMLVRDPLERMADGYFFGFQHRYNDGSVPQTTFKIGLEFYKRADWAWLDLSDSTLVVPAEGMAQFNAEMNIPADASPGAYEGVIFMNDPGDIYHVAHETTLPVVVNVIADLPDGDSVTLGGDPMADTLYQNSWTNGYFNWYGGGWTGAGDWRHYFLDVDSEDLDADNLLIHTSWEDYPTDFNTWVLGPTEDCASNGTGQCAWYQPGLGQPNPFVFGPYTLQPIGWSEPFRSGAAYPFHTSTGGPDDWLKVALEREGLHEIALHNVVYNGEELAEQFSVHVGTIDFEATMEPDTGTVSVGSVDAMAYTETGEIDLHFTPTLEVPDLEATLTGGLATTQYGPFTAFVPDTGGCYSPWCDGNVYEEFVVDTEGATRLSLHLYVPANQDADFFLVYDSNDNGIPEQGVDAEVGSSGNAAGTDEEIAVEDPSLGRYWAVIDGYDVDPDSGVNLDWEYSITAPGPLPTYPVDVFSDTVSIEQDAKFDPTTSSYSMTVTTTERVAALHATVTDIPPGADVDLYVTDETGSIVASSQHSAGDDEHVILTPMEGEYRFEEGTDYTVWVHGFDVPSPPVTPVLHVWWDMHNLWLSASHADVHPSAIGAGETVSLTLHFDQPGWSPGDPVLSARLIAGPSVLSGAFDELVTITRAEAPTPPTEWSPANLDVSMTADSKRGTGANYWSVGGVPLSTAMVAAGERVTYTVEAANTDPTFDSPNLYVDAWPLPQDYVCTYFGLCANQVDGTDYGLIDTGSGASDYGGGIEWSGTISSGHSIEFSYWVEMPTEMEVGQNHTSGADVYLGTSYLDPWIGWGLAGGYYRAFGYGFDGSKSAPAAAAPGEAFTYSISLANNSAEDRDVYFSDPLPDEVSFVSATGGATYDAGTHTVTWTGMLPGTTLSTTDFDIDVQVDAGVPEGTVIENQATLAFKLAGTPFATLEASTLVDDGMAPVLEIEKTVDRLIAYRGDRLAYTIVFENTGTEAALNAVVADPIPDYVTLDPDSLMVDLGTGAVPAPPEIWDEETGMLAYQSPDPIPPGLPVALTFEAEVDDDAPASWALINPVVVDADNAMMAYDSALTEVLPGSTIYLPLVFRNYTPPATFTLLHTNDFHGNLESDYKGRGGSAYMAGVIDDVRAAEGADNVLLVDAGDVFFGAPPISQLLMGESAIDIYNMLGYDVAAFGNHEFDKGQDVLQDRVGQSGFPWIGANIVISGTAWEHPDWVEPYVVLEAGGADVGFIGLDTDETPLVTLKGTTDGLEFKDLTETVLHYYDEVMAQADALVVLAHMGTQDSGAFAGLETVAQELTDAGKPVDLMIGGHQHEYLDEPVYVGDTAIIVAYNYGRVLGKADIEVYPQSKSLELVDYEYITINDELVPDAEVEARVTYWADQVAPLVSQVVGYTNVDLVRNYNDESNMGNLVADSMLWKADAYDDGAVNDSVDIAFTNPGGLRADIEIPTGATTPYTVTWGDTFNVLPFGNTLFLMDLTGAQVRTLLNQSASLYKGIMPTAGATWYWYNDCQCDTPTSWGTYTVTVGGAPLDPGATYRVVTNNFLAGGQDGWVTFAEGTNRWDTYYDMQAGLNEYIEKHNDEVGPIDYAIEGRIVYVP